MDLTDTRYEVENGLAWITIDRPDRMNAFRREDGRRADPSVHARVGVLRGRRDLPDRRGRPRLLRRRRPEAARGDRRLRPERIGAVRDRAAAPADPRRPEARDRGRQRRRYRRRARAPRPVRRDDRGVFGRRSVRSGPASGRSTAASAPRTWRAWSGRSARARSGFAAGATTPSPRSAGDWSIEVVPGERCAMRFESGPTTCSPCRRPPCDSSSSPSTPTPSTSPGSRRMSFSGLGSVRRDRRGQRGRPGVQREPSAAVRGLPRAGVALRRAVDARSAQNPDRAKASRRRSRWPP